MYGSINIEILMNISFPGSQNNDFFRKFNYSQLDHCD